MKAGLNVNYFDNIDTKRKYLQITAPIGYGEDLHEKMEELYGVELSIIDYRKYGVNCFQIRNRSQKDYDNLLNRIYDGIENIPIKKHTQS